MLCNSIFGGRHTSFLQSSTVSKLAWQTCILLALAMSVHLEEVKDYTCGNPPVSPNTNYQVEGNSANYSCDTGYVKVKGDNSLICGNSGSWTGAVLECSASSIEQSNSTKNSTDMENGNSKSNTGAVVAASVIAVVVIIILVVAVYIFKRKRQSRMMDKEKKMQIQMSSARNAGVYQDLTVSVPTDEKPPASPEHERLQAAEEA